MRCGTDLKVSPTIEVLHKISRGKKKKKKNLCLYIYIFRLLTETFLNVTEQLRTWFVVLGH